MELAQALILTNALGGFSSLGRAPDARSTPRGGIISSLGNQLIEIVCQDGHCQIYLLEPTGLTTTSGDTRGLTGQNNAVAASLLPGRLLIQSRLGLVAVPLTARENYLTADSQALTGSMLIAIELTVTGQPQRTPFLPAGHKLCEED